MGGPPLTAGPAIKAELDKFKQFGIRPTFMFNGLPPQVPQQPVQNPILLDMYEQRENAWRLYHENEQEHRQHFEDASSELPQSVFFRILREHDAVFFKAPYMAWAQMAHWIHPNERRVDGVQGPIDLIMFEHVEALILDFNFDAGTFSFVNKADIKKAVRGHAAAEPLTDSQFLDCCLLSGVTGHIQLPKHFQQGKFVEVAQMLHSGENARDILKAKMQGEAADTYARVRALILHALVLTLDGFCLPLTHAKRGASKAKPTKLPFKLSHLWGYRLPSMLYFLQSVGAIQTQVLMNVVQNQMIETIPQVDTEEYRDFMGKMVMLRTRIAHQVVRPLGLCDEGYLRGPLSFWTWFSGWGTVGACAEMDVDEWDVQDAEIQEAKRTSGQTEISLLLVVNYFSSRACRSKKYETFDEVLCATHLKALDMLGYFVHERNSTAGAVQTPSGLSVFSKPLRKVTEPRFAEPTVLLTELIKTRALTARHFAYAHSVPPAEGRVRDPRHYPKLRLPPVFRSPTADDQQYESCCLLTSRIWSLLPMDLKDSAAWHSEVSKDLLAFNTIVKALRKTLRNLFEVVAAVQFLESRTAIDPFHYYALPQKLPFSQESNTAMGIVIDYIMRSGENFDRTDCHNRASRLAHLTDKFPCCNNIQEDLKNGFQFWLSVAQVFRELEQEGEVARELLQVFPVADAVLRIKLQCVIDLGQHAVPDSCDEPAARRANARARPHTL
eukprot:TRINITY_DN405_c0_g1_i1.p1 TRINITY_DN405_c0_g1~~TRINITY_DN405_c0_g1_i1.p1  ORF type:complete len:809 (+),score=214.56 TRINITY_DN405_c0_g1_i1:258-2429(+)